VSALRRIAGAYVFNILKRLEEPQLIRLEAALDDLRVAADQARAENDA
jgi:hypothetical protein